MPVKEIEKRINREDSQHQSQVSIYTCICTLEHIHLYMCIHMYINIQTLRSTPHTHEKKKNCKRNMDQQQRQKKSEQYFCLDDELCLLSIKRMNGSQDTKIRRPEEHRRRFFFHNKPHSPRPSQPVFNSFLIIERNKSTK